jgi:alkanesulfonate monooxygenase SsuD/methylene tetrahydromethanopterin reductase-like flavin-dependent oxidoreductase (luciferase family)
MMELGIYTFGDIVPDPKTGRTVSGQERMRQMLDMATLADEAGLDIVGVGEHHALRYVNSDNFPLFGHDLSDYDELFVEKLGLFAMLNAQERVSWSGRFRPPLRDAEIAPRPAQKQLPVWIGGAGCKGH